MLGVFAVKYAISGFTLALLHNRDCNADATPITTIRIGAALDLKQVVGEATLVLKHISGTCCNDPFVCFSVIPNNESTGKRFRRIKDVH